MAIERIFALVVFGRVAELWFIIVMPVSIYNIARKYGLKNRQVLKKARSMGIAAAAVPSSLLDEFSAGWLEEEFLKDYPDKKNLSQ